MLLCTTYRIASRLDGACIPPDAMHFFVGGFWLLCVAPLAKKVFFIFIVIYRHQSISRQSVTYTVLTVRTRSRGAKGQTHRQYVDRRRLRTCNTTTTTTTKHNFYLPQSTIKDNNGTVSPKSATETTVLTGTNKNNWPDNSKA